MQQTIQRKQLVEADVLTISEQRIAEDLYNNSDLYLCLFTSKLTTMQLRVARANFLSILQLFRLDLET